MDFILPSASRLWNTGANWQRHHINDKIGLCSTPYKGSKQVVSSPYCCLSLIGDNLSAPC